MPPQETTGTGAHQARPHLFGKYELVQRLGSGGMAEVWRARMTGPAGFSRGLVIKRILPHLAQDDSFVSMFISEAQLSAKLSHPNIIQVFELGQVEGEYYIAMEYVRGRDLGALTRGHLEQRGQLPPGVSAYVLREVCRALAYAHEFRDEDGNLIRLIHRDVSPSNVMISNDGGIKLLDFGIAKALVESGDRTQTGTLKGKFAYMAPEQLEGDEFDHRADIFAAGIILHEILTGRRLFRGNNDLQTIALVKSGKVDLPSATNPQVPPELDRIVVKALARDPDARYQSALDMANDLDEVVHQLRSGSHVVAKLVAELFGVVAASRPGLAVAGHGDAGSDPSAPAPALPPAPSLPMAVQASGEAEGAATVVEISAIMPPPRQPVGATIAPPPSALAPSPPSDALAAALQAQTIRDVTGSLINVRPSLRRTLFIASVAAVGVALGVVVIVWSSPTPMVVASANRAPMVATPAAAPVGSPAAAPAVALAAAPAMAPAAAPKVAPPGAPTLAPTAAPQPAHAPPSSPEVTVSISSQPEGARVFLDDEGKSRGRTPLVLKLPRANGLHGIKLVARGYTPFTSQFSTASDVQVALNLVRPVRATHAVAHERRAPAPSDAAQQLADPFDAKRHY